jgi:sulfite reductase (NADPH) hemoprotein beta-component
MALEHFEKTLGRARISFANEAEIDEFADTLARFERGEISPDEWRRFRLVRGTYGQRQAEDAQMLRVKIPQGWLGGEQLDALADVAERYSRGFGHITTRQNVQFHFVKLHDVEPAMRRLADAGLTTREACGNSVRNITACPLAGVSGTEAFDVTPYADALTRYFLRHPLSSSLPRKFKIAFEGCADDHIRVAINDIGWIARVENGRRGFRVLAGGGTSTMATAARGLVDFLPAHEMLEVAEAIVRVFHALGDYEHKARNRMKFLFKSLGWERWHDAFLQQLEIVRAEGGIRLPFDPERPPVEVAPDWPRPEPPSIEQVAAAAAASRVHGPGLHPSPAVGVGGERAFRAWAATNVQHQKQSGYVTAVVSVPLGDLTGAQLRIVRDLAASFSDGTVRVSATQNLLFRWVARERLPALYERIAAAGLGLSGADTIEDVTSCPGAESCRLAVTQSRGLGRTLESHVRARPDLARIAPTLDVKISGCPNGCGQHHIAAVGFQGSLRKLAGQAVPQYFVFVGGGGTAEATAFGRLAAKVPARRAPIALERLARFFADRREDGETASAFFKSIDPAVVKGLLADLEGLTPDTATPEDFVDLGDTRAFAPETLDGECSA